MPNNPGPNSIPFHSLSQWSETFAREMAMGFLTREGVVDSLEQMCEEYKHRETRLEDIRARIRELVGEHMKSQELIILALFRALNETIRVSAEQAIEEAMLDRVIGGIGE